MALSCACAVCVASSIVAMSRAFRVFFICTKKEKCGSVGFGVKDTDFMANGVFFLKINLQKMKKHKIKNSAAEELL
jgi:hypothetical protein